MNIFNSHVNNSLVFYVPCASCMSPLFDLNYPVKQDVVFFLHAKFSSRPLMEYANGRYPVMTNYEPSAVRVMRFLGSAETVVTNSYHGLYWSTLLGKKVIVPLPCDRSRFPGFCYEPVFSTLEDLSRELKNAKAYPQALKECRDINKDFYAKVCRLFYPE